MPTLPAIIEAIDALEEIGRRQYIEIVLRSGASEQSPGFSVYADAGIVRGQHEG